MYAPLFDTSEILKKHATAIATSFSQTRFLSREALQVKAELLEQAALLESYVVESEKHGADMSHAESFNRMLNAKALNNKSLKLLERALQWKITAEGRKQIDALNRERKSLNPRHPRCKIIEGHIDALRNIIDTALKYDPDQARVPAGSPDGGQWTGGGDAGGSSGSGDAGSSGSGKPLTYQGNDDPPIDSVYPIEEALGALTGGEAIDAVRGMLGIGDAAGAATADGAVNKAAQSIEDYFGGKPDRAFFNPDGDIVMMKDSTKIRFDIEGPHGYDPHFHIQEQAADGEWIDAGDQHMYFFKKD